MEERRCRAVGAGLILGVGSARQGKPRRAAERRAGKTMTGTVAWALCSGTWRGFMGLGRRLPTYDPVSLQENYTLLKSNSGTLPNRVVLSACNRIVIAQNYYRLMKQIADFMLILLLLDEFLTE